MRRIMIIVCVFESREKRNHSHARARVLKRAEKRRMCHGAPAGSTSSSAQEKKDEKRKEREISLEAFLLSGLEFQDITASVMLPLS